MDEGGAVVGGGIVLTLMGVVITVLLSSGDPVSILAGLIATIAVVATQGWSVVGVILVSAVAAFFGISLISK